MLNSKLHTATLIALLTGFCSAGVTSLAFAAAIDNELYGRLIKVELEEDDDEWIYDLKLVHEDKVIRVEYNATTLELMSIKGRDVLSIIKNRDAQ